MRAECLDWLLIVGRGRLEQVLRDYVQHDNAPPCAPDARAAAARSSRWTNPYRQGSALSAHRAIEYTVARTILDTSARWSRFKVAAVSVVLW